MDKLIPLLMNFLEEHARPHVQEKVTEEVDETKIELKSDLPGTIMEYIKGAEANPVVAQIVKALGEDFLERIKAVTDTTVETASEGMDILLTNGVMNIARGVLSQKAEGEEGGGFNFDFLKSGKEGMVLTTMSASSPVIKQVSDNMGKKISAHIPAAIGGAIQEMIDEHGGPGGALGMAAGFVAKFLGGDDGPGEETVEGGGDKRDIEEVGGHTGSIQRMLQKLLAPKVLLIIQPYLQKFEAKMSATLENELRTKVFSVDYIKSTVMAMLTGGGGDDDGESGGSGFGNILGAFLNRGEKKESKSGGEKEDDGGDAFGVFGNMASQFLKNREQ